MSCRRATAAAGDYQTIVPAGHGNVSSHVGGCVRPTSLRETARMTRAPRHGTACTSLPSRRGLLLGVAILAVSATSAAAQTVVYRPIVTGFAPAAAPYVANYTPAGNYAAVTAFSPPVMTVAPMAAISTPLPAMAPASSVAVTSYAPAAMTIVARPVTAAYAPAYAPTYASPVMTTAAYAPAGEMFVAPQAVTVTAGYAPAPVAVAPVMAAGVVPVAPAAVAVPLYRRGPFGGLRPVRGAYWAY